MGASPPPDAVMRRSMKGNMLINFTPRLPQYCCGLLSYCRGGTIRFSFKVRFQPRRSPVIASVGLLERRIINCNTAGPLGSLRGRDGFQRPPCLTHSVPACVLRKRTTATKRPEDALDDVGLANFPLHQVSLLTKYV